MKRIISLITLIAIVTLTIPVQAANYELKELIPVNTPTTIVTNNFSYKEFYYNDNELEASTLKNNFIIFKGIKNISSKDLPVSISVGLFDKDKKNIGTINYCSSSDKTSVVAETILKKGEEQSYVIEINKKYLADKKTVKDIKYIAVLGDNITCRVQGSQDFVGMTVEEIGIKKNSIIDSNTEFLIKIMTFIIVILVIIFLYKFLFTNRFRNFDGEDVRQEFAYRNKELKNEREYIARTSPPKEKPRPKTKEDYIKEQETQEGQKENQEKSDLHNFYK